MLHEDEVLRRGTESPFLSALHAKNDTTKLFGCKTTKLFFSSRVRKQFKLLAVHLSHYAVVCEVISL